MDIVSGRPHRVPTRSILALGLGAALLAASTADADIPVAGMAPVSFAEAGAAIQTHTLANGLQVIVWPDHRIPSVALFNWVRVGSRNEGSGTTGLAHFFEHMMFNGTAHRSQGEFDRLLEGHGGSNNAYTTQDVTVYQDSFPRSALELVFDLESDRLAKLAFEPKVVESEREVVYSERRLRVEDNNPAFLSEQVQAMHLSRTRIGSRPSAGLPTSRPGPWVICRISITPGTRRIIARSWSWVT